MNTNYPNILLVSGNGRNSGKTSLACEIIKNASTNHRVIGLKISPHYHDVAINENIIAKENGFIILKEKSYNSEKDSSRMLIAGAKEVYYIQSDDENLANAFNAVMGIIDDNSLIVCESGGLRRKINPGVFLLLNRKDVTEFKPGVKELAKLADKIITFDDGNFNIDFEKILVSRNSWKIRD